MIVAYRFIKVFSVTYYSNIAKFKLQVAPNGSIGSVGKENQVTEVVQNIPRTFVNLMIENMSREYPLFINRPSNRGKNATSRRITFPQNFVSIFSGLLYLCKFYEHINIMGKN